MRFCRYASAPRTRTHAACALRVQFCSTALAVATRFSLLKPPANSAQLSSCSEFAERASVDQLSSKWCAVDWAARMHSFYDSLFLGLPRLFGLSASLSAESLYHIRLSLQPGDFTVSCAGTSFGTQGQRELTKAKDWESRKV